MHFQFGVYFNHIKLNGLSFLFVCFFICFLSLHASLKRSSVK